MCVCLLVCLSSFYRPHDICPLCGAASEYSERAGAVVASGPARELASACTARARARMPYNFSTKKIAALMPFKNKTVRARACCRIRNWRDFQKKREKENQHATSQVQFTVCLLLECLLFESYWIVSFTNRVCWPPWNHGEPGDLPSLRRRG